MQKVTIVLFVTLSLLSCQQNANTGMEKTANSAAPASTSPAPAPVAKNTTAGTVSEALPQEKPLSAWAQQFFTTLLWQYDAAVVTNDFEKGKDYLGKWIKFHPDRTLETGFYNGPITKGSWAFDEENQVITFTEEGERPTTNEFRIKTSASSDDIMIWVGTKRFNQNNIQIKMLRNSLKQVRQEVQ